MTDQPKLSSYPNGQPAEVSKLDKVVAWSQIVSNLGVIVALAIAVLSYWQQSGAEARGAALERVGKFSDGALLEARQVLLNAWEGYDLSRIPEAERTPSVLQGVFERLPAMSPQGRFVTQKAIGNIADYFDGVHACRVASVCDPAIIDTQLGGYAHSFYCIYENEILRQRAKLGNPSLGEGLRQLSAQVGPC